MDVSQVNDFLGDMVSEMAVADYEGQDLVGQYFKGKVSLGDLIKQAGGLNKIATKGELESFLRNKFMIKYQSDSTGVKESQLVAKVKALLKRY